MSPDDCFDLSRSPFKDTKLPEGWDFSTVAALLRALTQRCGIRPESVDGYEYMVVARAVHSVMRILGTNNQVRDRPAQSAQSKAAPPTPIVVQE